MNRFRKIHDRVVVSLLIENGGCINNIGFNYNQYVGDPINLVRIYNHKGIDELLISDKSAFVNGINFKLLGDIASVSRFPLSYCGDIKSVSDAKKIVALGYEKIFLNSTYSPELAMSIADILGTSSVGVCIDYKKNMFGAYKRFSYRENKLIKIEVSKFIDEVVSSGVGEIVLRSAVNDGKYIGFDFSIYDSLPLKIYTPILIAGGASNMDDIKKVFNSKLSGCVISSLFTFYGAEKGVLPNYPGFSKLEELSASE